ncbi:MAG: hypothetical protein KIT84_04630 [Labilithrix sp.]|nr:hypothetical protein [Labilithrix sp.]MCW5810272.1 hypothetical protein [Labilithrix sp.]
MRPAPVLIGSLLLGCAILSACSSSKTPNAGADPDPDGGESTETLPDGAPAETETVTVSEEKMSFQGRERRYLLVKPKSYDAERTYPLVLSFHGNPGYPEYQRNLLPFESVSKDDAIVVYPAAAHDDWDFQPTDNVDIPWMLPLVDDVASKVNIDKARVLGYGYSGGAYFISAAACRVGGIFEMIAILSGGAPEAYKEGQATTTQGCVVCDGTPLATLVVHGMEDKSVVPFEGGDFARKCWAETNGCTQDELEDSEPSACQTYKGCSAGHPTKWCAVPGQGHDAWKPSMQVAWDMFQALP